MDEGLWEHRAESNEVCREKWALKDEKVLLKRESALQSESLQESLPKHNDPCLTQRDTKQKPPPACLEPEQCST